MREVWFILLSVLTIAGIGKAQTCMSSVEQPVVTSLDPPSGTTGTDAGLSTRYTITGERLDYVSEIVVEVDQTGAGLTIDDLVQAPGSISFRLGFFPLQRALLGTPATVMVVPNNTDCLTVTTPVNLHDTIVMTLAVTLSAQPGTTIVATTTGTCLPNVCGDSSSTFAVFIGGIELDPIESTSNPLVARFPEFDSPNSAADVVISTEHQEFILPVSAQFMLFLQTSDGTVMPSQGQRGTRIVITGTQLLGYGTGISLFQVTIGDMAADIVDTSIMDTIELRAFSGQPGTFSISINTTQEINGNTYDGPYTFLENVWTQLEDGLISDIIPPAAQEGVSVTLCGSRLLGGGSSIVEVSLAGLQSTAFNTTPSAAMTPFPGDECLIVEVPSGTSGATGVVEITADTGALVQSSSSFTLAEITEISPSRGQPGTRVTIRGTALLSGYGSQTPTVTLSGIEATLVSASSTEVVVTAMEPLTSDVIGQPGSVVISVQGPNTLSSFNFIVISDVPTWTYEMPGQIDTVSPTFGQFGTLVTITGTNLLGYGTSLTRATVGGMDGILVETTDTLVTLRVPDGAVGQADIVLFSDSGAEVRGVGVFEFRSRGSITQVSPTEGQSGTFVSITGDNLFGHGSNITQVDFGDIPATIDFSQTSNTSITVRVQPNPNITQNTMVVVSITSDTQAVVESATPMWTYLVQGTVSDIQPPIGQEGTRVTITGTNLLGGGTSADQVLVDGVETTIESASGTSVVVRMLSLDSQVSIFPGQALIIADTGAIVVGGSYTHRAAGSITSFSPTTGREGTMVTITGQDLLGSGDSIASVTVAGNPGIIISSDNAMVEIVLGAGAGGAQGPIQFTINTGATIISATNFMYDPPGSISEIDPLEGAEGLGVSIRGMNLFPSNTELMQITIGGNPVSRIVTSSASEISVIVGAAPSVNPMMAEVVVTASDGSFVRGAFFRFVNLVISLPGRRMGRQGTLIDITLPASPEFDVADGLRATVDDEDAEIVSSTATTITVRVPRAKRLGTFTADVAIENPQRLVARLQNAFTYLPEGAIYTITPNVGQRGTTVVFTGENFLGGGTTVSSATLAGVSATVISSSDDRVEVQIMENPQDDSTTYPLEGDIILTADTGAITIRLNGFSIVQPGQILMVDPASGQVGTQVTITGTDLLQGQESVQEVMLAGQQAVLIEPNATDTQIVVEASESPVPQSGLVEITLSNNAVITSDIIFEYLEQGQITRLDPNHGTQGTRLLIEGTNLLGGGNRIEQVFLGEVEAIVNTYSNEIVNVTAQAAEPGPGNVEIVTDTGARISRDLFWTYAELGSITSINPPIGQRGIEVTLDGTSLLGSSGTSIEECRLAGIVGTVVSFNRDSVVCAAGFFPDLTSQSSSGTGPAEILTDTGVVITSDVNIIFTYYIAEISTVIPSTGNNGTIVQISGINLFGFPGEGSTISSVTFGAVPAIVVASTENDITVRVGLSERETQNEAVRVTSSVGSFLEVENAWSYSANPQIVSISPSTAFPGDTVFINGENLLPPGVTEVVVIVGQTVSAEAQIINDTTIQFVAGVHQSTDNTDEALPVQIVYNTGEIAFEPLVTFMYNATRGIVDSVSPIAGMEGTEVTIAGRNLLGDFSVTAVYLAGVPVAMVRENATNEEIIVIAGPGPDEGQFRTVVIETSDGQQFGLAGNAWRYYPLLNGGDVSPSSGQNGTIVTINLSTVDSLPIIENVTLSGYPGRDLSLSPSGMLSVTAETPDSITTPLLGDVVFSFADSTQLRISNTWTYLDPVEITSVSPSNMQGYFNSLITLNGENFQAGGLVTVTDVYLAGVDTEIQSQSDTMLVVRITELRDSRSQSFVNPVVIVSQEGATYTSPFNFTYIQVQVDSSEPQQGQRGTRVTITGTGLLLGGSTISSIMFGGVMASMISATDSEIIASAGDFPSQTNISDITYRVDTEAELTVPNSWRYIVPGEITSVSPEEGAMGTIVTIMGTNLFGGGDSAEMVLLNNVPAESIVTSFDSLIQVVAGDSSMDLTPGNVQIVSNTGAITESSSNVVFDYLRPGEIASTTPTDGQNGTRVTIMGSFFHNGEGVGRILLAGVEATIESTTENQLQPGFPGTYIVRAGRPSAPHSFNGPVTIISHFNTMSISSFNFIYLTEGDIEFVSPTEGQVGTVVTIEGINLLGGGTNIQRAYIAGVMATVSGTPTDSTVQLIASSSPGPVVGDIVLESDTGAIVRRVDGWRYVEAGLVLDIQPRQGQWGTRIVITGERMLSGGDSVQNASLDSTELEVTSSSAARVEARVGQPSSPVAFNASTVTLTSNFQGTLTQIFNWQFLDQSSIETIDPSEGFGDAEVTIIGTNLLGGGTTIVSVSLDSVPATIVSSNDTVVVVRAGFNLNGQQRVGDIELVSDTGAITLEPNAWTYGLECPAGEYGNFGSCLPCHEECSICIGPNSDDCFECVNFAIELENTTRVQCVPTCFSVSTLDRVCMDACGPNSFPQLSSTENITFCELCNPQCDPNLRCNGSDATQCDGCRSVLNVLNQTCIDECPLGTYTNELNECIPCDAQCTTSGGCIGPNRTDCVECENFYVNVVLMDGLTVDACLESCPTLYYQEPGSTLCSPCNSECLEGCTGPSPFDCMGCRSTSFVFPNATTMCVAMCNPDPARMAFYEDTRGVCQPCSSRCSLTGGCVGPTASDCNGCRFLPGTNDSIPQLDGECVNACPNVNSSYTFYADNNTNQCEECDRVCTSGCIGPLAINCIEARSPLAAEGGAIAFFLIVLILVLAVVVALVVYIVYQRKRNVYHVSKGDDVMELGIRETKLSTGRDTDTNDGVENPTFKVTDEAPLVKGQVDEPGNEYSLATEVMNKTEGGSQELPPYIDMKSGTVDRVAYAVPTPKSQRKPEADAPPRPLPYKKPEEAKPPPPRPPSPTADDVYTDMEASAIQEVHVNPIATQDEEYSEMVPGPIIHPVEELYDDAESMQPTGKGKPPAPAPKSEEQAPLLDDMYEDTETAIAQVNDYKRMSRDEGTRESQRNSMAFIDKPPELPSRPAPKKRPSVPLPETPLQKSLSNNSFSMTSPSHQPAPASAADDIYIEPEPMGGPIEESLYEELPTGGESSEVNQIPLPPKPNK